MPVVIESERQRRLRNRGLPVVAVAAGVAAVFVSPILGLVILVATALWLILWSRLGLAPRHRRDTGKTLIQAYWWLAALWIVCGAIILFLLMR